MVFMSKNKSEEKKEFLVATRKRIAPGITNAPVWILQKAGKRIWNPKAKRHWRTTDLGKLFKKKEAEQKGKKKATRKSRKIKRTVKAKAKYTRKSKRKRDVL
jgi:ribosomal protein L39E